MGRCARLIDFGSTYTKVVVIDVDEERLLGRAQAPSTVESDVTIGLMTALARLPPTAHASQLPHWRLACSSAAGGLRMVAVGLVPELTVRAAQEAALGAGAKLVGVYAHRLVASDLLALQASAPDIVLLAGGTDGGDSASLIQNASALATARLPCPIVLAGNRAAASGAAATLRAAGMTVEVVDNVLPKLGSLNVEPAREAIRRIFIERIVVAKGIDRASREVDVLMPTPTAVLKAAELLAGGGDGWGAAGGRVRDGKSTDGFGSTMVIDVGGATTDAHSVCSGHPTSGSVVFRGIPEPYAKRTVEGDLGLRENAPVLAAQAGVAQVGLEAGTDAEAVSAYVTHVAQQRQAVPATPLEGSLDQALAHAAVRIAAIRHAGRYETLHTALGPRTIQMGKDLTGVATLVGTGGIFSAGSGRDRTARATHVLRGALWQISDPESLRPRTPAIYADVDYLLYAIGLLAADAPEAALRLARRHLQPVEMGQLV